MASTEVCPHCPPDRPHGRKYSYKPLEGDRAIRLLELQPGSSGDEIYCKIIPSSLAAESIGYTALSYVWGPPEFKEFIFCDDDAGEAARFHVTHNLHGALRALRHESEVTILWIDQICIDQSNLKERSQQVELFADIYSSASQTRIWMGEKIETTGFAVGLLRILDQLQRGINPCSSLKDDNILAALGSLSPEKFRTGFKLFVTTVTGI